MKKLLLSLGTLAIFGIGTTTSSLNLFDNSETIENSFSRTNDKKLSNSKKENISHETNIESSCCPKILNN